MMEIEKQHIPIYNASEDLEGNADDFCIRKIEVGDGRYENTSHPHRHHHYTLLVLCAGVSKQFIDFKEYEARDSALILMRPGQVHYEVNPGNSALFMITFTSEFLLSYSADNHWEQQFSRNLYHLNHSERTALQPYLELMLTEFREFKRNRAVLGQLLLAFLEKTEAYLAQHLHLQGRKRYSSLMRQFTALVEQHFLTDTKVGDYAAKLFVSAGHLNDVVKEMTGNNAKTIIDERRVLEAKRLLFWTQLPIREIGWKIGFEDPAYFTRFFKKHTGMLPAKFQRELQGKLAH